jgi:hypothetical protein
MQSRVESGKAIQATTGKKRSMKKNHHGKRDLDLESWAGIEDKNTRRTAWGIEERQYIIMIYISEAYGFVYQLTIGMTIVVG